MLGKLRPTRKFRYIATPRLSLSRVSLWGMEGGYVGGGSAADPVMLRQVRMASACGWYGARRSPCRPRWSALLVRCTVPPTTALTGETVHFFSPGSTPKHFPQPQSLCRGYAHRKCDAASPHNLHLASVAVQVPVVVQTPNLPGCGVRGRTWGRQDIAVWTLVPWSGMLTEPGGGARPSPADAGSQIGSPEFS